MARKIRLFYESPHFIVEQEGLFYSVLGFSYWKEPYEIEYEYGEKLIQSKK